MGLKDIFAKLTGKPSEEEIDQQARKWISHDYKTFLKEERPEEEKGFDTFFIKACRYSYNTLKFKAPPKTAEKMADALKITELEVTPDQVMSLTIFSLIVSFALIIPFIIFLPQVSLFMIFIPLILAYLFYTYPTYLAAVTKIKASDETVKVILYMVIYLRLNPQVEGALEFAAAHCYGPIGKDLRKIIWDLQIRRYVRIGDAISSKIEKWLLWDKEFVESMNLIQSLSLESNDQARERTLEKTLTYILDSTYEKMKSYARELRVPMTFIQAMGITLPVMGLVMFPMISIFLWKVFNPAYLIIGYIGILPAFNYFYLRRSISKRPGAFSYPDISNHPDLPPEGRMAVNFGGKRYLLPLLLISVVVAFLIMIPGIAYFASLASECMQDNCFSNPTKEWEDRISIEYSKEKAPFLMVYSLSVIWGLGAGLSIYFIGSSYQRVKIRDNIKAVEDEFQVGLFRLSDVLTSGMPVESALEETIKKYREYKLEGSPMYSFFMIILKNIREMGMTLKRAVFDTNYGAILHFPSLLIKDIMNVLVSAAEKSSYILSTAARTISSFLMKTKNVENLLKELLDEVSAAVQIQGYFIAPFICGVVGSMATFIIQLLQMISNMLKSISQLFNISGGVGSADRMGEILGLIQIEKVIPATVFQLVVGIYMIEVVIILAYFLNGVKNGFDKTTKNLIIGKMLVSGLILYSIVLIVGVIISSSMLGTIGSSITGGLGE